MSSEMPLCTFCVPFPEGAAIRVDPIARLRLKDRSTPERALQCRKGYSAKLHLFAQLRFGGPAAPRSQPTLLSKGRRPWGERVSAVE